MTGTNNRYTPLPWQVPFLKDTASPVVLATGAAGGGKSRAAAEKIVAFCLRYPNATGIAMRKAREFAAKSVAFAIASAAGSTARWHKSDLMFTFPNGSRIFLAGMKDDSQREALRSIGGDGAADIIWWEEANAFTEQDYNEMLARLRGTAAPWRQAILTTNPAEPTHWIKRRLIDGNEATVYVSTLADNPYLPAEYATLLQSMTGVLYQRLVRGLWVQAEGALWSMAMIDPHRVSSVPHLARVVVGVDPSASAGGADTGIVVAGIGVDGAYYVLADRSLKGTPHQWATAVWQAYTDYAADAVIAEVNQGGDMVTETLRRADGDPMRVVTVRASRGKVARAEPIVALYEQGLVHHVGRLDALEDQLLTWEPGRDSPDRLDALVWALTNLSRAGKGAHGISLTDGNDYQRWNDGPHAGWARGWG